MTPREIIGRALGGKSFGDPHYQLSDTTSPNGDYFLAYARDIEASLSAAGYVIVPRELTDAMHEAGYDGHWSAAPRVAWRRMIAAWEKSSG